MKLRAARAETARYLAKSTRVPLSIQIQNFSTTPPTLSTAHRLHSLVPLSLSLSLSPFLTASSFLRDPKSRAMRNELRKSTQPRGNNRGDSTECVSEWNEQQESREDVRTGPAVSTNGNRKWALFCETGACSTLGITCRTVRTRTRFIDGRVLAAHYVRSTHFANADLSAGSISLNNFASSNPITIAARIICARARTSNFCFKNARLRASQIANLLTWFVKARGCDEF